MIIRINKDFFNAQARRAFKILGATFISASLALSVGEAGAAPRVSENSPGGVQLAQTQIRIDGAVLARGFNGRRGRYDESELEGLIIDRFLENNRSLDINLSEDERAYALVTALKLEDKIYAIVKGRELVVDGERILSVGGQYIEEMKLVQEQLKKTAGVYNSLNKEHRYYKHHRQRLNTTLLAITKHYENLQEKYKIIMSHYQTKKSQQRGAPRDLSRG